VQCAKAAPQCESHFAQSEILPIGGTISITRSWSTRTLCRRIRAHINRNQMAALLTHLPAPENIFLVL
jgi:polyphosphate kinase 2 (PPK2 family)